MIFEGKNKKGMGILEIVLAVAVFVVAIAAVGHLFIGTYLGSVSSGEKYKAAGLSREGIEAVRSIKSDDFDNLTALEGGGVELIDNKWEIVNAPTVIDDRFTRSVDIASVNDEENDEEKEVTVTVSWENVRGIASEISLMETFTNWEEPYSFLSVTENLVLHLDADEIEGKNDGDSISQWDDLSGQENHTTQADSAKQPTYRTNQLDGKPIAEWSGSESMASEMGTFEDPIDIFVVGRNESTDTVVIHDGYPGGGDLTFLEDDGDGAGDWRMYTTDDFNINAPGNPNDWNLLNSLYDGNSSEWRVGGELLNQGDVGSSTNITPITIGSDRDEGRNVEGGFAEIIVYDKKLSTEERENVENYLGEKWLGWE